MKLTDLLHDSSSTAAFKQAVDEFLATGAPSERVFFERNAPPIKVARTLTKAIRMYPQLAIESVRISARSGCEFFRGEAIIRTTREELRVQFDWNCKWKAQEMGWVDYFGFADQARAARDFDYECFRTWQEHPVEILAEA